MEIGTVEERAHAGSAGGPGVGRRPLRIEGVGKKMAIDDGDSDTGLKVVELGFGSWGISEN